MKRKWFKRCAVLFMGIIAMIALASCTTEEKTIVIGEGDWDSNAFHDQVAKFIIQEGYGVTTDIVTADTAVLVSGLKSKDIDISLELWSDNIPTYKDDVANGDYQELSVNFDDNMQGIYVPTYLVEGDDALAPDLKSVQDLPEYANLFPDPEDPEKGIIYGGPEGWSATAFLHNKMEVYGLDEYYNFKTIDSNATLSATLSSAYEKGEPWLGYNWEPTWIMGMYDMTLLEDEAFSQENFDKGVGAFPTVDVMVVGTPEFTKDFPEITEFLKNYTTSSALTSEALAYMQENDVEADAAAKWFLKEHDDVWKTWVPDDVYQKVVDALQ